MNNLLTLPDCSRPFSGSDAGGKFRCCGHIDKYRDAKVAVVAGVEGHKGVTACGRESIDAGAVRYRHHALPRRHVVEEFRHHAVPAALPQPRFFGQAGIGKHDPCGLGGSGEGTVEDQGRRVVNVTKANTDPAGIRLPNRGESLHLATTFLGTVCTLLGVSHQRDHRTVGPTVSDIFESPDSVHADGLSLLVVEQCP